MKISRIAPMLLLCAACSSPAASVTPTPAPSTPTPVAMSAPAAPSVAPVAPAEGEGGAMPTPSGDGLQKWMGGTATGLMATLDLSKPATGRIPGQVRAVTSPKAAIYAITIDNTGGIETAGIYEATAIVTGGRQVKGVAASTYVGENSEGTRSVEAHNAALEAEAVRPGGKATAWLVFAEPLAGVERVHLMQTGMVEFEAFPEA